MKLRAVASAVLAAPLLALLLAVATPSCNSSSAGNVPLGGGCTLNSDCQNPLHCIFQLCHQQCRTQEDCTTPGSICFIQNGDGVCVTQQEDSCTTPGSSSTCLVQGTTCVDTGGGTDKCLQPCTKASDCTVPGQACTPANGVQVCQPAPDGGGSSSGGNDGGSGGDGGSSGGGDAAHDAGPSAEAGVLGYVPSNFGTVTIADGGVPEAGEGGVSIVGADGGIDWSSAPAVTVTGSCTNDACLPPPLVVTQSDGSTAHLFVMKSLKVQSSAVLQPNDTAPVIFAVLGDVDVQGTISVGANSSTGGPGATTYAGATSPQGPGGGGNGYTPNYPASGGGGGSFCGVGGKGGATSGAQAVAGSTYPGPTLVPLVAGSAGGWVAGYAWGAGGGALQISSGTSILVRTVGIIDAGGGGGMYGGGGSGGAILLEAPSITIQGNVTANGGGGGSYTTTGSQPGSNGLTNGQPAPGGKAGGGYLLGGNGSAGKTINGSDGLSGDASIDVGNGGGGAGFIRLNSSSGNATVTGTVSPDLTTNCATQGTLH